MVATVGMTARRPLLLAGAAILSAVACVGGLVTAQRLYALAALDGVLGLPILAIEDTAYSEGYSHAKFRAVRPGMTEAQVRDTLGAPLDMVWMYESAQPALDGGDRLQFTASERVADRMLFNAPKYRGRTTLEMRQLFGPPDITWWSYSTSPGDHSFRIRAIEFRGGRVTRARSEVYLD